LEGNPCLNFVYLVVKRLDIGIILGRGEWCAHLWSLTRRPLRLPLPLRCCFGYWDEIHCPGWWFKQDPLQESHIPGRNVGKLTLLLYPIVLPVCM
jgi:hypothetical protein